jgi:hypothetical protein
MLCMSFGHILDQKLLYSTLTETYYSITSYNMAEHSCTLHADVNGDVTISMLMADVTVSYYSKLSLI